MATRRLLAFTLCCIRVSNSFWTLNETEYGHDTMFVFQHQPHKPTSSPTETPTHNPTHAPTDKPTRLPSVSPTEYPTFPPTEAWDKQSLQSKPKQKSKKNARRNKNNPNNAEDELLINTNKISTNRFELFLIDTNDWDTFEEFEQFLVNQKVYNSLLIRRSTDRLKIPKKYPHEVLNFHTQNDLALDHFGRYLNDITKKEIDRAFIEKFIHTTNTMLLAMNNTLFDSLCDHLQQYKSDYVYIYTICNYHNRKQGKQMKHKMPNIPITNATIMFVLDYFTFLFQSTFWMTWHDALHIIQNTTYGQSDKIHPILKNGWNAFRELAEHSVNHMLPQYIQLFKDKYTTPDKTHNMAQNMSFIKQTYSIYSSVVSFVNIFNIIKERLEISKIIFDKNINSNHGSACIGWALQKSVIPLSFEYKILSHLGYDYASIRASNIIIERSGKSRKFTIAPIAAKDLPETPKNTSVKRRNFHQRQPMSKQLTRAMLNGTDQIKIHEVLPKHMMAFEQQLLSRRNNDLLILTYDGYHGNLNQMDEQRIKYYANEIDKFFQAVLEYLEVPTSETDVWIDTAISKLCEMEAAANYSIFVGMYKTLDAMVAEKSEFQRLLLKYLKDRYLSNNYRLHRMESIEMLTSPSTHIEDAREFFGDAVVMKMVLELFRMSLLNAFNLKINAAVQILEKSEWTKCLNVSLLHSEAQWFHDVFNEHLNKFMKAAKQLLCISNATVEDRRELQTTLGALYAVCNCLSGWKMQIDIADTIYEFKYVEGRLDRDVNLVMVDFKYSFILDAALQCMGYTKNRIQKYKVTGTLQKTKKQQSSHLVFRITDYRE